MRQTGQQMLRAAVLPELGRPRLGDARRLPDRAQPGLRLLPERVVEDAQLRDLGDEPGRRRVEPGEPPAGLRVLDVALPVPDQPADIELVMQDAGAAQGMAADGGVAPGPAARTGDPVGIEVPGDRPGRLAGGELPEDAPDDLGLGLVDLPAAMDRLAPGVMLADDVVAVAESPARPAFPDPALQPAMGLGGQILQEEGVHRALQPDMELADLALGQGHDPHAAEAQLLEQGGDVLLVAGEPVERLGDDDVEGAGPGVLQQLLVARPKPAGAGAGGVAVGGDDGPALPVDPLPADPDLVLDRGLALEVGRVPGVDHSTHGSGLRVGVRGN